VGDNRLAVVGTTGSGKTTLARRLARQLGVPHIELDALHWEPGWIEAPDDVFRERVTRALRGPAWVVDGNYHAARDIVWPRATHLVWLDYPLAVILWRLTARTWRRIVTREALWSGNRERWGAVFGRDSLYAWVLHTYWRRKREYPALLARPEHQHLQVVRLKSPRATVQWAAGIKKQRRPGGASLRGNAG
jgi:adenylate kinase family enzyme